MGKRRRNRPTAASFHRAVIVEALAVLATRSLELLHHQRRDPIERALAVGGTEVRVVLRGELHHQLQRHVVEQRERPNRHAGDEAGILDGFRRNAFFQQ